MYAVNTECFLGDDDGNVSALRAHEVEEMVEGRFQKIEGTDFELPCELVLLAMGFLGPEREVCSTSSASSSTSAATSRRDAVRAPTSTTCSSRGDMGRGQSLIVWAIAEGRACAAAVDEHLMGETLLPAPISPDAVPMR